MAFVEDLSVFFSTDTPGVVQTMLAGVLVTAAFDNAYALAEIGGAGMAATQPALTLATSAIPPTVIGWFRTYAEPLEPDDLVVKIHGERYKVSGHEPDGTGVSVLLLVLLP